MSGTKVPEEALKEAIRHFEDFYEEVFTELYKYGELEGLYVCDNVGEHLMGNVYAKFYREEDAKTALTALNGRYYAGKILQCEFSPVTYFRAARCRQYEEGHCDRGGYCNYMHLNPCGSMCQGRSNGRCFDKCTTTTLNIASADKSIEFCCPHSFLFIPKLKKGGCERSSVGTADPDPGHGRGTTTIHEVAAAKIQGTGPDLAPKNEVWNECGIEARKNHTVDLFKKTSEERRKMVAAWEEETEQKRREEKKNSGAAEGSEKQLENQPPAADQALVLHEVSDRRAENEAQKSESREAQKPGGTAAANNSH